MKWYKYIFCPHVFNFVIILNAVKVLVFEWKNTLRNVRVFWMVFAKYSIMSNRTSFKQQLRYIAHPYPHVWKVLVHFFCTNTWDFDILCEMINAVVCSSVCCRASPSFILMTDSSVELSVIRHVSQIYLHKKQLHIYRFSLRQTAS